MLQLSCASSPVWGALLYRVRHEAGEALGAIGTPECFNLLRDFSGDPCLEVAQTCQLALQRIQHYAESDRYSSGAGTAPAAEAHAGPESCLQATTKRASDNDKMLPKAYATTSEDCLPSASGHGIGTPCGDGCPSPYLSVDPAPAAPLSTPTPQLRSLLLDEDAPIFKRYTALFALRNKGGREEV